MVLLAPIAVLALGSPPKTSRCLPAEVACAADAHCASFGVHGGSFQLHGCADADAQIPNQDWTIFVPASAAKKAWRALGKAVNIDEGKCSVHPKHTSGHCGSAPPQPPAPPVPPLPLPYEALGAIDVGTLETSIFMFNGTRYIQDNIGCGYVDHWGNWPGGAAFKGHSYVRIRELETGITIANVSETISTDFVSSFVDHRPTGDVLWLSALNHDRCRHSGELERSESNMCGTGVKAIASRDLKTFVSSMALPNTSTCNTEVANVESHPSTLPPHRYVMILEEYEFKINNNVDGDLTHGWVSVGGSRGGPLPGPAKAPHASSGGPSIRHEAGHYYVITGGRTVELCRSTDLGASDPWNCTVMVKPTGKGGATGPGDGAVSPYGGFARDQVRKGFPVMTNEVAAWDWNSNDADVCCTGGSSPSFIVWGASTQGARSRLPPGSPNCVNAIGRSNMTLAAMLQAFFDPGAG